MVNHGYPSQMARRAYSTLRGKYRLVVDGTYDRYLRLALIGAASILIIAFLGLAQDYFHFIPDIHFNPGVDQNSVNLLNADGYVGYIVLFLLSPIPDYILVPAAGFLAYLGEFNIYLLFVISSFSMALFFQILYYITRYGGRPLFVKFLRIMRISDGSIEKSETQLHRHGALAVFAATFVPFLPIGIAFTAGLLDMKGLRFFVANFSGFALRYALLLILGFQGSSIFETMLNKNYYVLYGCLALVAVAYMVFYAWHKKSENVHT